ncbi:MAG: hypothetical protein M3516_05270 [Actinomycetota bacterium]|nr:hypothetical protein [Actinomycetota bacterium]
MNHRLKTVAPAIALALIAFFVATAVARGSGHRTAPTSLPDARLSPAPTPSSPPLDGAPAPSSPAAERVSTRAYAIATTELAGLPPDPEPGAIFDLWVTWSPPVVEVVRIQKLIPGLTLEEIVPAVTSSGAEVAIFLVPVKSMSDLLWADRFGELSVTGLP